MDVKKVGEYLAVGLVVWIVALLVAGGTALFVVGLMHLVS